MFLRVSPTTPNKKCLQPIARLHDPSSYSPAKARTLLVQTSLSSSPHRRGPLSTRRSRRSVASPARNSCARATSATVR